MIDVTLPLRLVSEANARGSWPAGASRAAEQRRVVGLTLRTRKAPSLPCVVRITRIAPRELDDDNLARACKAVRDEVAAFLGVDDRNPQASWAYGQRRGKAREYAVRITVRSLDEVTARVTSDGDTTRVEVWLTAAERARLARDLAECAGVNVRFGDVNVVIATRSE